MIEICVADMDYGYVVIKYFFNLLEAHISYI